MIPDVIGLPVHDAQARLSAAGIVVGQVVETRPDAVAGPRKRGGLNVGELTGDLRVVRVRGDGPVDFVITRERYIPQVP